MVVVEVIGVEDESAAAAAAVAAAVQSQGAEGDRHSRHLCCHRRHLVREMWAIPGKKGMSM